VNIPARPVARPAAADTAPEALDRGGELVIDLLADLPATS